MIRFPKKSGIEADLEADNHGNFRAEAKVDILPHLKRFWRWVNGKDRAELKLCEGCLKETERIIVNHRGTRLCIDCADEKYAED